MQFIKITQILLLFKVDTQLFSAISNPTWSLELELSIFRTKHQLSWFPLSTALKSHKVKNLCISLSSFLPFHDLNSIPLPVQVIFVVLNVIHSHNSGACSIRATLNLMFSQTTQSTLPNTSSYWKRWRCVLQTRRQTLWNGKPQDLATLTLEYKDPQTPEK